VLRLQPIECAPGAATHSRHPLPLAARHPLAIRSPLAAAARAQARL
jgi:hypothetical protein